MHPCAEFAALAAQWRKEFAASLGVPADLILDDSSTVDEAVDRASDAERRIEHAPREEPDDAQE